MSESKPYTPPNPFGIEQKYWERIWNMRLLDDMMMRAVFDNNPGAVQLVLRIILDKADLLVTSVRTQREYKNLFGHSVRLDVEATDSKNVLYNIEVQRADAGAYPERARYNAALMDAHTLREGQLAADLPETYVIMITESDYWKQGLPAYHIDRVIAETGAFFGDRCHIIYANGAYEGDNSIGKLMADFRAHDPKTMHYLELSNRMEHLKYSEEEVADMCRAMEDTYKEGRADGLAEGRAKGIEECLKEGRRKARVDIALRMLQAGKFDTREIAELSGLSILEVEHLRTS